MKRRKKFNVKEEIKPILAIGGVLLVVLLITLLAFSSISLVGYPPNMYEGEVVQYEFCPNFPSYCEIMKSCADRDTSKSHSISEGIIESDREIQGGELMIYMDIGGSVAEDIGSSAYHNIMIEIFNYEKNSWDTVFSFEGSGNNIDYKYEIGETKPREGGEFTEPRQCTGWYDYRGYPMKSCSYWNYEFNNEHVNPETGKDIKLRLDMTAYGRDSDGTSLNCVKVETIYADFIYTTCPECPEPSEWSGCDKGQTEEWRTNYKCSAMTNFDCEEYKETRECIECNSNDECMTQLQECFAECDNGICISLDGTTEKPCEEAEWMDYPVCEWNTKPCNEGNWVTILITIIGVVLVIVVFLVFAKKKKLFKR